MSTPFLIGAWLALLATAYPYVQRIRHREAKPLAAYIVFVIVFSLAASVFFWASSTAIAFGFGPNALNRPPAAIACLILTFAPAVAAARWIVRRPARRPSVPD